MAERVLIWGAGAVGGTIGAHLARAGRDVLLVDTHAEHVARCNLDGLRIEGPVDAFTARVRAITPDALRGEFRCIALCVKAQATAEATRALRAHLHSDGYVLSVQNGLNVPVIAGALGGAGRVVATFINFGADWLEPGRILYGNRGAVVVGEPDGEPLPRTREAQALLRLFEPDAELSDDVQGYLWGKLGYGAMLFATALNNDSMSDNFADAARTPAFVALAREVTALAHAQGIRPRGFNGYAPEAFAPDASRDDAAHCIGALAQFTARTAKTHSGIWRDLAVRRRPTEAPGFLAPVLSLADGLGVPMPVFARLAQLIADVETGRRGQGMDTFDELLIACDTSSAVSR